MRTNRFNKRLILWNLFFVVIVLKAQDAADGTARLDELIIKESYTEANEVLETQLTKIFSEKNLDALKHYPYYVGKIALERQGTSYATKKAENFLERLEKSEISKKSLYQAYMSLTDFYDEIGDLNRSLKATKTTYEIISGLEDATSEEIGKIVYNLGVCYLSLGNVETSKTYFKKSLNLYRKDSNTSAQNLSDCYNAIGAVLWMSTELDSAKQYYKQGIEVLSNAETNPIKNLFNATSIRSNISLLEQSLGNLDATLRNQEKVITDYEVVIKTATDTELREKAKQNQLIAIYNMSSFYAEAGNLGKGKEFLEYSYAIAKKILDPQDPELPQYQIALGELELSLHNYESALRECQNGLQKLQELKVHNPFWEAKANYVLAKGHAFLEKNEEALNYYNQGELLFREAFGNAYSREYLGFIRDNSFFLLKINRKDDAIKNMLRGHNYLLSIEEQDNLEYYKFLRDICQLYFEAIEYNQVLKWANKGLNLLNKKSEKMNLEGFSTAQIDYYKPSLVLFKTKAIYKLHSEHSLTSLRQLLNDLEAAISILESRKKTALDIETRNLLNAEYNDINAFYKELCLAIYEKTERIPDLRKILALHESGIYSNIRTKLNMPKAISFSDVPEDILKRESQYKKQLSKTLIDSSTPIGDFFKAQEKWDTFLDSLKTSYPEYYKLRYATLRESLNSFGDTIPESTTLLRYFFIGENLYVYVADNTQEALVKLDFGKLVNDIRLLSDYTHGVNKIGISSKVLYDKLWKPLEQYIKNERIVVFPDKTLFNLSFELLTPTEISSFEEWSQKSLLAKYTISYNYSLLLLENKSNLLDFENDFIAFAPSFDKEMKNRYQMAISDSIHLDRTYLTLLPQPFSYGLASKFGKRFNGKSFLNEKASKQVFTQSANEHKIIHIGTHAESNNIAPELSRLVFAKNVSDSTNINDNYLYTYEIYNQNLNSNLAILTACETGKPSYQPGEGMISLAHAFNYAGSQSILTSLWQIDEQSSSRILEFFYNYLEEGKPKDVALRLAKLEYLKNAEGRTLHPQYWAGLILMGDTGPIDLKATNNWWIWVLSVLALAIVLFLILRKSRRSI